MRARRTRRTSCLTWFSSGSLVSHGKAAISSAERTKPRTSGGDATSSTMRRTISEISSSCVAVSWTRLPSSSTSPPPPPVGSWSLSEIDGSPASVRSSSSPGSTGISPEPSAARLGMSTVDASMVCGESRAPLGTK